MWSFELGTLYPNNISLLKINKTVNQLKKQNKKKIKQHGKENNLKKKKTKTNKYIYLEVSKIQ